MIYNYHHYNILKYPCDFVGENVVSQTGLEPVPLFLLAMDYNAAERMVGEK